MLAGRRPVQVQCHMMNFIGDLFHLPDLHRLVRIDDRRRVQIAVSDVAVGDNGHVVLGADRADVAQGPGHRVHGNTDVFADINPRRSRLDPPGRGPHHAPGRPERLQAFGVIGPFDLSGKLRADFRNGLGLVRHIGRGAIHLEEKHCLGFGQNEFRIIQPGGMHGRLVHDLDGGREEPSPEHLDNCLAC